MKAFMISADPSLLIDDRTLGVRTLTLNRTAKANALTAALMETLAAALAQANDDNDGDEVLVLRSASPRLFCAGADISEFMAGDAALAAQERALLSLIRQLAYCPAPLVAVARGKASGAGAILLSLADVVIAAEDLEIDCPEIRFGMYPVIVEAVLQDRLPPALAARLCLTGESLVAREAARLGLVTDVLAVEGFEFAATQRLTGYLERREALRIARRSRLQIRPATELIQHVERVTPLMAENFSRPGVRERIATYLAGLRNAG